MNAIAFNSDTEKLVDANFISIYNEREKDFDYYVEKLLGINIENEENPTVGNVWVPFVNGKREDWTHICRNGRIVEKKDQIVWKFLPYEVFENNIPKEN